MLASYLKSMAFIIVVSVLIPRGAYAQGFSTPDTSDLAKVTTGPDVLGDGWSVKSEGFGAGVLGFPEGQTKGYEAIFVNGDRSASISLYSYLDSSAAVMALTTSTNPYWQGVLSTSEPLEGYGDGGSYHLPLADFGQYLSSDMYAREFVRGSTLVLIILTGVSTDDGSSVADTLAMTEDELIAEGSSAADSNTTGGTGSDSAAPSTSSPTPTAQSRTQRGGSVAGSSATSFRVLRSPRAAYGYSLFIVRGNDVWNLYTDLLRPDALGKLKFGSEIHGTVTLPQSGAASILYSDDGTTFGQLYLAQGSSAWLVVPDEISAQQVSDLGKLNQKGDIHSNLPTELLLATT